MSRAAKIFTRKQMYRFSENRRQSPELKKKVFLNKIEHIFKFHFQKYSSIQKGDI